MAMMELLEAVERPQLLMWCAIAVIPLYLWLGQLFFNGWHDFLESLRYLYQPTWLSVLRGEFHEDNWASLKFLSTFWCV